MKNKIYLIFAFLMIFSIANAQVARQNKPQKEVPQTVEAAFNTKFPNKEVIWFSRFQGRYDTHQVYEGKFMLDDRYSTAVYTPNGALIAFVSTVEYLEIPLKTRNYMEAEYAGRAIIDAALVTRGGSDITYEIGIYIDNEFVSDYSDESEHPIPAKVDSCFDDDFLG